MDDNRIINIARGLARLDERLRTLEDWAAQQHGYQARTGELLIESVPDPRPMAPDLLAPPPRPVPPAAVQTIAAPAAAAPPAPGGSQAALPLPEQLAYPHVQLAAAPASPASPASAPAPPPLPASQGMQGAPRPTPPPAPAAPAWSLSDFEQLLSGRGLAWIGGLAIVLGAIFFLSLAFTRGWIGPAGRVSIGLVAGVALVAGGARFFERREALFGHVLVAVGLGVTGIGLVAATRLYDLIAPEYGLLGSLLVAVGAAVIAIRADSQVVAGYGLVAALAAPPLLGADPTQLTIAFLATALVGTTAVSLNRTWAWLPPLAFLLAAPQLWAWVTGNAPLVTGLVALSGFWLLNALAAGGEEFSTRRQRLRVTSASLLQSNAVFFVAAGFALLGAHDAAGARGLLLLVTALAHFLLAGACFSLESDRHPFGLLAAGIGVTALSIAVPIQLGGPAVPIAWAAQAAALVWVYSWRRHWQSAVGAIVLGSLSIAHLLAFEYSPLDLLFDRGPGGWPFLNSSAGTLGCILLALAVAGYFVRSRPLQTLLASVGALLVVYALPFELSGVALLAGWAALFVLVVALERGLTLLPGVEAPVSDRVVALVLLAPAALLAAGLAVAHLVTVELPFQGLVDLPATPFVDQGTLATVILIAASLLAAAIERSPLPRRVAIVAAFALAHYLMPFELPAAATVVAWAPLALALFAMPRWDSAGGRLYSSAALALVGLALLTVFTAVAPAERLAVHAQSTVDHPFLWSGATAALGAIVVVLAVVHRLYRERPQARQLAVVAGVLTVYLLSVGVVDEFQRRVGTGTDLVSLQKQAQVALSILWAALGGAAFVAGVVRWVMPLRLAGLALLALATTKVYLYDLASLDATYKVASFIGLGILLLASSYAYQRLKPQMVRAPGGELPMPQLDGESA